MANELVQEIIVWAGLALQHFSKLTKAGGLELQHLVGLFLFHKTTQPCKRILSCGLYIGSLAVLDVAARPFIQGMQQLMGNCVSHSCQLAVS